MTRCARAPVIAAWIGASVCVVPAGARAQILHVYGPEGDGLERRALVVVERAAGGCEAWADVALEATDAELTLGEPAGDCARWVSLTRASPTAEPTLRARTPDGVAERTVPMGAHSPIHVEANRAGTRLHASVQGVPDDESLRGWAIWAGGSAELERSGSDLVAEVPADPLLAVIVRAGARIGATALAANVRTGEVELLLAPSDLLLASGGAARPLAVIVVADAHGRLSRSVPLEVQSERGRLARLEWLAAGVAAVWLSAPTGVASVDLRARAAHGAEVVIEQATCASWPASATIALPPGPTLRDPGRDARAQIHVAAQAVDGSALDPAAIGARCGAADRALDADGTLSCPVADADTRVVAFAVIDGAHVPLAQATLRAEVPPVVAEVDAEPEPSTAPPPPAASPHAAPLRVAAGVDLWARGTFGVGGVVRTRVDPSVALDVGARYLVTLVDAVGQGLVRDSLSGLSHAVEVSGLARFAPFTDVAPLDLLVGGGLALSSLSASVGDGHVAITELGGAVLAGVGATFQLGDCSLGVDGILRASTPLHDVPWEAPWLRFQLEVSGGFDVRP